MGSNANDMTYNSQTVSVSSFWPFGMLSKNYENGYRFGFNGQEKVDEISGTGNHNTALFWEYDTRLWRRWNLDPKPQISISDYAVMANNPIWFTDVLGDRLEVATKEDAQKSNNTFVGGQLDVSDDEQTATATIGGIMNAYAGTNGPLKGTQTSVFVHEVVGEGMAFLQYGDFKFKYGTEARLKYGAQQPSEFYKHPKLRPIFLQIIQSENLYWQIINSNSLRTGVPDHSVSPEDIELINNIPVNFSSSFYKNGDPIERSK